MDNLTHSLVGAALAEVGPRYRTVLATPTLVIAANVPDVDVVSYFIADDFAALAWRRGITHGLPALVVWPFVVAGLMLAWDRWGRRRRDPAAPPARVAPLLVVAALGALTHPLLDWLNTYGMRWWLPFDGRWTYGDSVFIIDPWLWLLLGAPVFLARSSTRPALVAWAALAVLTSLLVLGVEMVPASTKVVWLFGILALAVARWARRPGSEPGRRRFAATAAGVAAGYVLVMIGTAALAERGARGEARALGLDPVEVMTGPRPATFAARDVILRSATAYHLGTWRWAREPRLELTGAPIPLRSGPAPVITRALSDPRARRYLVWARYPYAHAAEVEAGWRVRIGDPRYGGRAGLGGLEVFVPR